MNRDDLRCFCRCYGVLRRAESKPPEPGKNFDLRFLVFFGVLFRDGQWISRFEAPGLALCLFFGSLFQAAPDSIFTFGRIWTAFDESPCFGLSGQMRRRSPWAKNQARFLRGSVFAREDQNEGPMGTEFANGAARLGRDGSALSGARGFAVGRARSGLAGWVLPAPCALPLSSPPAPSAAGRCVRRAFAPVEPRHAQVLRFWPALCIISSTGRVRRKRVSALGP